MQAMSKRVFISGLGFITSIGNDQSSVKDSLLHLKHGVVPYEFTNSPRSPISVLATVKGFDTREMDSEDWTYPDTYRFPLSLIRGLSPHGLYALCSVTQAIEDAGLDPGQVSNPETGLFTASAGSIGMMGHFLNRMRKVGVDRVNPKGIVATIAGTLNFSLVAHLKIKGSSCGYVSACASSGHALGYAFDEIRSGRQQRMIVVGAEDGNEDCILPFAGMRALSVNKDPGFASRPFDKSRDGFVGTGGAATLILESEAALSERGVDPYCEMIGWAQSSDGYNPVLPEPEGEGLKRAIETALRVAEVDPPQVDYVNAHAPSTPFGDLAEMKALKSVFGVNGTGPHISSTKALHGHGLSMASALEAGVTALSLKGGFSPGSANITELDDEAAGLNILRETVSNAPAVAISNSSGFGGANVSVVLKKV